MDSMLIIILGIILRLFYHNNIMEDIIKINIKMEIIINMSNIHRIILWIILLIILWNIKNNHMMMNINKEDIDINIYNKN